MKRLRNRNVNLAFMFVSTAACWYVFRQSFVHNNFEWGLILLPLIPVLIGFFTLGLYLVVDLLARDQCWLISIMGAVFNAAWVWMSISNQPIL